MKLKTREEASAFCKFIIFEKKRHLDDIEWIDKTLMQLSKKWEFIICTDGKYSIDGEELTDMWVGLGDI